MNWDSQSLILVLSEKSTKITSKFQINHSGYTDRLFQIPSQNDMLGNLKWWGCKIRKTNVCLTVRPSSRWNESGRSFGILAVHVIVFSWGHGSLLQSYTILVTQLLSAATIPATPFSPLSFLAFPIHGVWRLLAFIVSWLLIIAFSLGVWFCSFRFLNSTPVINCWLTLCVKHSAFARENIGLFIQSGPPLLATWVISAAFRAMGSWNFLSLSHKECGGDRHVSNNNR